MTPAIGLLVLGAILLKAGWKNQNIVDVLLGRSTENTKGRVPGPDPFVGGDFASGDFPTTNAPQATVHGVTQFDGHPVAKWIVPYLRWGRAHGWRGQVTSGYRSPTQVVTPSPGMPVAPQGQSNHNGTMFPKGAVDVSDADGLESALRHYPGPTPLHRGTAIGDPIHFSATGR